MRSRVLVVDDEHFFLEAIDEILSERGYEVVRAADGAAAMACGRNSSGKLGPPGCWLSAWLSQFINNAMAAT